MEQATLTFYKDIATVLISLSALGLTIWNGYMSRMHNKMSQRPILSSQRTYTTNDPSYKIINCGNGIAVIDKTYYYLNGKEVSLQEFLRSYAKYITSKGGGDKSTCQTADDGTILRVDSEIALFKSILPNNTSLQISLELEKKYAVKIEYSSIYGEKFEYISSSLIRKPHFDKF